MSKFQQLVVAVICLTIGVKATFGFAALLNIVCAALLVTGIVMLSAWLARYLTD